MAELKQVKRVSWAPDVTLRQVRLFLSEDAPCQSGLGAQDNLQAKASWLWHSTGMGSDDSLPPGFEALPTACQFNKINVPQIPLIKWQCPPKFLSSPEWLVVAGEESEEVAVEKRRQLGVLEAIYPRPSSIPPNASVTSEVQNSSFDDVGVPLIPITAIEDDDTKDLPESEMCMETSIPLQQTNVPTRSEEFVTRQPFPEFRYSAAWSESTAASTIPVRPPAENPAAGPAPVAEPDVMAAASAVYMAIMKSNEAGSLVDRDLLIKLLSNPSLIEKLASEYGTPRQALPHVPSSLPPPPPQINVSATLPPPPVSQSYPATHVVTPSALSPQPPPPVAHFSAGNPPPRGPLVKDINYYKNLIQQHGEEKGESPDPNPVQFSNWHDHPNNVKGNNMSRNAMEMVHDPKQRELKPRIPKPCVYFNSPRGCRNGASCFYQHDGSHPPRIEQQKNGKRIKLDREISGRI